MIEKTQGYIISRKIYRDTSLILKIYTRDLGKIEGIVKGVRKIEDYGRYDGLLNLFSEYEVIFYRRRSELKLFVEFYILSSHWELTRDYKTFWFASSGIEFLDYIMPYEQPNREIYQLIGGFFNQLGDAGRESIYYAFLLKLLKFSGFNPQIDVCLLCKQNIIREAYFSVGEGGVVCSRCKERVYNFRRISPGVIRSILFLEEKSWRDIARLKLNPAVKQELQELVRDFIGYHLHYLPRTWTTTERKRMVNV